MKWVTREYVHLDRVATPWLIKRFIDPAAEFVFVPWGQEEKKPADATPFALPGAELGPHDGGGTTFEKVAEKYGLTEPAIVRLGRVVRKGVAWVLHDVKPEPDDVDGQIAVGLISFAEGIWMVKATDTAILDASYIVYDALYANFRTQALIAAQGLTEPSLTDGRGPSSHVEFLRGVFTAAASG